MYQGKRCKPELSQVKRRTAIFGEKGTDQSSGTYSKEIFMGLLEASQYDLEKLQYLWF